MRPNLSLESIAGALAVLGTGVIVAACGGDAPKTPVDAKEVPGATDQATPAGGAAAGSCGAGSDHKAGEAACSADTKPGAATDVKPADPVTASAPATPATPATPAAAAAKGVTGTPAPATTKKPAAAPKKAGASSCGAGTCSAKK